MPNEPTQLEATLVKEPVRDFDPATLLDDVLNVLVAWHTHVINAEAPAGFHAFLCTAAPRYLSMIVHLRLRHREIFKRIENLHRMLRHGESRTLLLEYEAILHDIDVHDELETELLADALDTN